MPAPWWLTLEYTQLRQWSNLYFEVVLNQMNVFAAYFFYFGGNNYTSPGVWAAASRPGLNSERYICSLYAAKTNKKVMMAIKNFFWWNGQAFDLWPWRFCHQFWSVVLKRPLLVVVGSAPPLTDSLSVSSTVWTQYMASASLILPKGKLKVLPGLLVAVLLLLSLFFFLFQFNKEAELRPFAPTRMCWRVFSLSLLWDSMVALRSTCWHTC